MPTNLALSMPKKYKRLIYLEYIEVFARCSQAIKMQVELRRLKEGRITAACERSSVCNFFQNESCFRGNKPYSFAWLFPSSSFTAVIPTLPCPLPYAADPGRWMSRAVAPGKLCLPTSWLGRAQSLSSQSFLTEISSLCWQIE